MVVRMWEKTLEKHPEKRLTIKGTYLRVVKCLCRYAFTYVYACIYIYEYIYANLRMYLYLNVYLRT